MYAWLYSLTLSLPHFVVAGQASAMASLPQLDIQTGLPPPQGLYNPALEKDACGVGFIVNIKGQRSHKVSSNPAVS